MNADGGPPISIEVTLTLELQPDEVWPDGVPDNWTAADVLAAALEAGSFQSFNDDWDADLFGADIVVSARGGHAAGAFR